MIKFNCLYCGVEREYLPSRSSGKYCSIQCQQWLQVENKMNNPSGCSYGAGIRKWCYGNLKQVCAVCDTPNFWNGHPLRLQVDHVDGNTRNNLSKNLRMICPNCHTQSSTWGVKNISDKGKRNQRKSGVTTTSMRYNKNFGVVA